MPARVKNKQRKDKKQTKTKECIFLCAVSIWLGKGKL